MFRLCMHVGGCVSDSVGLVTVHHHSTISYWSEV